MTVDEALSEPDYIEDTVDAYRVLQAEVRRLRAAVEEIGDKSRTFQIAYGNYRWVKVDEVLAILEPKP